jgi:hypothetical protein
MKHAIFNVVYSLEAAAGMRQCLALAATGLITPVLAACLVRQ